MNKITLRISDEDMEFREADIRKEVAYAIHKHKQATGEEIDYDAIEYTVTHNDFQCMTTIVIREMKRVEQDNKVLKNALFTDLAEHDFSQARYEELAEELIGKLIDSDSKAKIKRAIDVIYILFDVYISVFMHNQLGMKRGSDERAT